MKSHLYEATSATTMAATAREKSSLMMVGHGSFSEWSWVAGLILYSPVEDDQTLHTVARKTRPQTI